MALDVGDVVTSFYTLLVERFTWLTLVIQALGIIAIIYVISKLIHLFIEHRKRVRLKRIESKVDLVEEKIDLVLKKIEKQNKKMNETLTSQEQEEVEKNFKEEKQKKKQKKKFSFKKKEKKEGIKKDSKSI